MILKHLTGGIDLPELAKTVGALRLDVTDNRKELNLALADHIAKANARMAAIEGVVSNNTAQCQIRMNGLQDLIASRALAEDVETLKQRVERLSYHVLPGPVEEGDYNIALGVETVGARVFDLEATVAALTKQVEALTATKLSEVKARKAPKKDAAK